MWPYRDTGGQPSYIPLNEGEMFPPSPRAGRIGSNRHSLVLDLLSLPACEEGWAGANCRRWRAAETTMDNPRFCHGPDKRVPPKAKSEGHACHARWIEMDDQT